MDMNYGVILGVTIVLLVSATLWYGPIFGNAWKKIHGWEKLSNKELKAQEQGMWKLLLTEFIMTFILLITLAFFINQADGYRSAAVGFFIWLGIMVPSVVSVVIWGSDIKKYMIQKIMIILGYRFFALLLAGYILGRWM